MVFLVSRAWFSSPPSPGRPRTGFDDQHGACEYTSRDSNGICEPDQPYVSAEGASIRNSHFSVSPDGLRTVIASVCVPHLLIEAQGSNAVLEEAGDGPDGLMRVRPQGKGKAGDSSEGTKLGLAHPTDHKVAPSPTRGRQRRHTTRCAGVRRRD